ncbi:TPA: hypothetical protein ACYLN4_008914, partial [Burkholderia lata]
SGALRGVREWGAGAGLGRLISDASAFDHHAAQGRIDAGDRGKTGICTGMFADGCLAEMIVRSNADQGAPVVARQLSGLRDVGSPFCVLREDGRRPDSRFNAA